MKKVFRALVFFLIVCFLSVRISVFASGFDSEASSVSADASAKAFLLMDCDTGDVLSAKSADLSLPMASTTKIMTCIVALEKAELSDEVSIPAAAVGVEGSSVYLSKGETLKLEELLYALMLESANDAAVAIALHVSGSIDDFAGLMNEKASELGLSGTHYVNPHGLPAKGHYSTARDLCKLMRYGMNNDAFRTLTGTGTVSISAPGGKTRFLSNHNKLLRLYDPCTGGKTGYTKEAGRCLVTSAKKDDKELVCATLGDPDDWRDHSSLFEYGFSLYEKREIAAPGSLCYELPVVGGEGEKVTVKNEDLLAFSLRGEEKVACEVDLPRFLYAPVRQGQVVGEAVFSRGGEEVARVSILAQQDILKREEKLTFWSRLWQKIRLCFD